MTMHISRGSLLAVAFPMLALLASARVAPPLAARARPAAAPALEGEEEAPRYVGAKLCKTCHYVPSTGRQYKIWKDKDPHSHAFKALRTDKAKEVAASKGIADPQTALECLACHESDGGIHPERRGELYTKNEGVGCEGCHAPGEKYALEEIFAQPREVQIAAGLRIGDLEMCGECHDEDSPRAMHPRLAEGSFDVEAGWKRIEHPIPEPPEGAESPGDSG